MAIERYSAGADVDTPVGAGKAYAQLLASASSPVSVKHIEIISSSNVGGHVALVRAFAVGTAAATGIHTGVAHRTIATLPTGPAQVSVAWTNSGIAPTGYTNLLRQEVLPTATGQARTLWDSAVMGDLVLEPSEAVLVLNHASGTQAGGLHINFTWAEGRR